MNEFDKHEKHIKLLAERGESDEARRKATRCSRIRGVDGDYLAAACVYLRAGAMYEEAIADRETLISSGNGILRDYYQLEDNSLSAGPE